MYKNLIAALIFGGFAVAGGIQATGNNTDAANTAPSAQQKAADETLNSSWGSSDEWDSRQKAFEEQKKKVSDIQKQADTEFKQLEAEFEAGKAKQEAQHQAGIANREKIRQQYENGKAKVDAAMAK